MGIGSNGRHQNLARHKSIDATSLRGHSSCAYAKKEALAAAVNLSCVWTRVLVAFFFFCPLAVHLLNWASLTGGADKCTVLKHFTERIFHVLRQVS